MALALVPVGALPTAAYAEGEDDAPVSESSEHAAIAKAEEDGGCETGQALVVYHASGAAKGSTGTLAIQSDSDPLADAGFSVSDTWDLSAADGALLAQSDDASALASGSDVRVALVERDDESVADLVTSLEGLDFVECAGPNCAYQVDSADAATTSAAVTEADAAEKVAASTPVAATSAATTSTSTTMPSTLDAEPMAVQSPLEPDGFAVPQSTLTDDPLLAFQWALVGDNGIDYQAALDAEAKGTSKNVVAVIDTGVDYDNPDLKDQMWTNPGGLGIGPSGTHGYNGYSRSYDPMPGNADPAACHGTHVAGIIAAQSNNGMGVASVAGANSHTKIMGLRVTGDAGGSFLTSSLVPCYEYLVRAKLAGVNVVAANGSFGALSTVYDPVLDYLVNQAGKAGVLSCFGSANDGKLVTSSFQTVQLESPYAVVVGSSNEDGSMSSLTNYNPTAVDVAAPGTGILSTYPAQSGAYHYDALVSKLLGKSAAYYDADMASLKPTLVDMGTKQALSDQSALTYGTTTIDGESALSITLDPSKLPSGHTSTNAGVLLSWGVPNPFEGTSVTASDYSVNFSQRCESTGFTVQSIMRLLDSNGNDLVAEAKDRLTGRLMSANVISTHEILEQITGGPLSGVDTSGDTLTAQVLMALFNPDGSALSETATCAVSAYGIGKTTNPNGTSPSAYAPYGYDSGTSMATPMITGSVAELAALDGNLDALQLRGLVCGGTEEFASAADQEKDASGGHFTFADALDGSKVNANTWSITTSGNQVTVHGYNLDDATLAVDKTAVTPISRTADAITFTANSSLLDGKAHRFDVTDGTTGRTYKAAYLTPDSSADSLVRVHDLPTPQNAGTGVLVSATGRLFCADSQGTYLYSCTNPSDATSSWAQLAAPGVPWTSKVGAADNRAGIAYAYLDGKVYAFATDDVPATATESEQVALYGNTYDIATNAWSGYRLLDKVGSASLSGFSAGACAGSAWCYVYAVGSDASMTYSLYSCKSGASEFTKTSQTVDSAATWSPASNYLTVGTSLYGIGYSSDNETPPTFDTILTGLDPSSGKLSSIGSLGYGKADGIAGTASILAKPEASVGNGLVIAGQTLAGSGDLQLIGTDASMTKLGSFGLSSADGLAVGSMAMLGGRLYLNCASRATEDGLSTGLYSLPAAAAAKLATTDVAETASVSADGGGTAAVSDWRGGTASELSVRSGDTVTWTATADAGHTFVGWYDAAGNEVSSDAVYSATAGTATALTARFSANVISPVTPASAVAPTSLTTPSTSDGSPAGVACALALAGFALVLAGRKARGE
jgi:plastocyanin